MAKLIYEIPPDKAKEGAAAIKKALLDLGVQADVVEKAFSKQEKEVARAGRAYDRLARDLDPAIRKQQEFERGQRTLQRALELGRIDQAEHARMSTLLANRYHASAGGLAAWTGRIAAFAAPVVIATAAIHAMSAATRLAFEEMSLWINESSQAERQLAQLAAVVKSTGGVSGLSVGDLVRDSKELQGITLFTDEEVQNAEALLLTFTRIGGDVVPEATRAILDMSTAMNQGLKETAVQVGKALQDPVEGVTSLQRVGVRLTDQQKDLIKQLVETGRTAEAQRIILRELNTEFGGSAEAARMAGVPIEALRNTISDLREEAGNGLVPVLRSVVEGLIEVGESDEAMNLMAGLGAVAGASVEEFASLVLGVGNFVEELVAVKDVLVELNPLMAVFWAASGGGTIENFYDHLTAIGEAARQRAELVQNARDLIQKAFAEPTKGEKGGFGEEGKALLDRLFKAGETRLKELDRAAQEHERTIASLRNQYDPWGAAVRQLTADQNALVAAFTAGKIGPAEFARQLEVLEERLTALTEGKAGKVPEIEIDTERAKKQLDELLDAGIATAAEMSDAMLEGLTNEYAYQQAKAEIAALEKEWEDFAKATGEDLLENLQSALVQIATDLAKTGDPFLDGMIRIFAELVVHWAITQAKMLALSQKRIAAEAAMQKAALGAGGQTGNVFGSVGNLFSSGSSVVSSGSYAYSSFGSAAVAAGASLAIMAGIVAWAKHNKDLIAKVSIESNAIGQFVLGQATSSYAGGNARVLQNASGALALANQLLDELGAYVANSANVTLKREGQGSSAKFKVIVDGIVTNFGRDLDAALEYAAIQSVKSAELRGLDPQVQTAIRNSVATTMDAFQDDIRFAMQYTELGLDDVALAFRRTVENYRDMIERAVKLGLDASTGFAALGQDLLAQRNQILGIQESPEDRIRRQAAAYEAERAITLARLELEDAELAIKEQQLRADLGLVEGEAAVTRARLDLRGRALQVEGGYLDAEAQMLAASLQQLQAIVNARNQIAGILDELRGAGITDVDIAGAIRRASSGFGGHVSRFGRAVDDFGDRWEKAADELLDFLNRSALGSTSPYTGREQVQIALEELTRTYQSAAGGNVDALGRIDDVFSEFERVYQEFTGGGQGFLGDFREVSLAWRDRLRELATGERPDRLHDDQMAALNRLHDTAQQHLTTSRGARAETDSNLKNIKVVEEETRRSIDSGFRQLNSTISKLSYYAPRTAA